MQFASAVAGGLVSGCVGFVVGSAILFAVFVGVPSAYYMFFTSSAVLIREAPFESTSYHHCTYFTGLRQVSRLALNPAGCERFVPLAMFEN